MKAERDQIKEKFDFLMLEQQEKEKEINRLYEKHKTDFFNMNAEKNIEIEELKSKVAAEKLKAQQDKNMLLKDKRDMQDTLKELKKQVKEFTRADVRSKRSSVGGKGLAGGRKSSVAVGEVDKDTQTTLDGDKITKLLANEKKFKALKEQFDRAKEKLAKSEKSRQELLAKLQSKSSIELDSDSEYTQGGSVKANSKAGTVKNNEKQIEKEEGISDASSELKS